MKKDVFDFLDVFNSETILKDPMFIQALKDFEKMGFIKIHEDKIEMWLDIFNIKSKFDKLI